MEKTKEAEPLVSILCATYNHEPYIGQCLEGFVMQKTNFPFEVLVHDDASKDKTADVIREYEKKYPNLIKPIYQTENKYQNGIDIGIEFQLPRAKGKYIAFCEGDDYWIDENKLQMQVDFLEQNQEYGLCYTEIKRFFQATGKFQDEPHTEDKIALDEDKDQFLHLLHYGNVLSTLTVVCKKDIIFDYYKNIHPQDKNWLMGDYPLWLYFSRVSRLKFFPEVMGVYRILKNSACHFTGLDKKIKFYKSAFDIQNFFSQKYNTPLSPAQMDRGRMLFLKCLIFFDKHGFDKKGGVILQEQYKLIKHPTLKQKIFYLCSHSLILWHLLAILRKIIYIVTLKWINNKSDERKKFEGL